MARPSLTIVFERLFERFGPQSWWPADDTFEMMVGAVLTQNTAWRNVELSIAALKKAQAVTPQALHRLSEAELQKLVRSSGFFQRKSHCLKSLATVICRDYQGGVASFLAGDLPTVRQRLLDQPGIGPETADCMVLYGAGLPIFVVDTYTRRIFSRLGLLDAKAGYATIQYYAMRHLPADAQLFNEFHALLVELGKVCCRSRNPLCSACPLNENCCHACALSDVTC